jgi:AraC family transcriptional regulator
VKRLPEETLDTAWHDACRLARTGVNARADGNGERGIGFATQAAAVEGELTSHIQLVEQGRVIGLDGKPWATEPVNAWCGFPCEVHRHMRRGEVAHRHNPFPLVFLRYGSRGRSKIVSGAHVYDLSVAPLQIDVFPAAFRMDHGWWDCTPGELVSIELDGAAIGPRDELPALRMTLCGVDETLARVVDCMRSEIEQGCPSGKLFADGLSLALLARLQVAHAESPTTDRTSDRFPERVRRRVVDHIDAHLGADLRIASLAAVADLSGAHFIRMFRRSFGMTPHRYVIQRRLEAAKVMLATGRPLASIAYVLGFSSQAHFTATFKRYYGVTPGWSRRAEHP